MSVPGFAREKIQIMYFWQGQYINGIVVFSVYPPEALAFIPGDVTSAQLVNMAFKKFLQYTLIFSPF